MKRQCRGFRSVPLLHPQSMDVPGDHPQNLLEMPLRFLFCVTAHSVEIRQMVEVSHIVPLKIFVGSDCLSHTRLKTPQIINVQWLWLQRFSPHYVGRSVLEIEV